MKQSLPTLLNLIRCTLTLQPAVEKQKSYAAFIVENANVRDLFLGGILELFICLFKTKPTSLESVRGTFFWPFKQKFNCKMYMVMYSFMLYRGRS